MATHAVIPYDQRLGALSRLSPAARDGIERQIGRRSMAARSERATAPILFGEPGTNGQHAFFQLFHQGTEIVPVDFLIASAPFAADPQQHQLLIANCLAQSEALMRGRSLEEVETQLRGKGLSRRRGRQARAAQGLPRQPAIEHFPLQEAVAAGAWPADRAL